MLSAVVEMFPGLWQRSRLRPKASRTESGVCRGEGRARKPLAPEGPEGRGRPQTRGRTQKPGSDREDMPGHRRELSKGQEGGREGGKSSLM